VARLAASPELIVSVVSLAISIVTSIFAGYLALAALRFTARPKLRVLIYKNGNSPAERLVIRPLECVTLHFRVHNVGAWYAKPAATKARAYLNLNPALEPLELRHDSLLDSDNGRFVRRRDGGGYFRIIGLNVNYREPPEEFDIDIRAPEKPGIYKAWTTIYAEEGDCGVHPFEIHVIPEVQPPDPSIVAEDRGT
jgi:hypothetical protein